MCHRVPQVRQCRLSNLAALSAEDLCRTCPLVQAKAKEHSVERNRLRARRDLEFQLPFLLVTSCTSSYRVTGTR